MSRKPVYGFREMKVGDHFLSSSADWDNLRSAAAHFGARNKRKYSVFKQPGGKCRCIRVK